MIGYIYKLVFADGMTYVGSTDNVERRVREHISLYRKKSHYNPGIVFEINKYGLDRIFPDETPRRIWALKDCEVVVQKVDVEDWKELWQLEAAEIKATPTELCLNIKHNGPTQHQIVTSEELDSQLAQARESVEQLMISIGYVQHLERSEIAVARGLIEAAKKNLKYCDEALAHYAHERRADNT